MQKNRAIMLQKMADSIAHTFSMSEREHNYLNEGFQVHEIIPTSESTAIVKLKKTSGKYAMAFCYWINMSGGQWKYFFPTYDHCVGMETIKEELRTIELINFEHNFDEIHS
jgi:hypothetical protein